MSIQDYLSPSQYAATFMAAAIASATQMKDKEVFVTLSCPTADIARKLKDYYLAALKRYGKWQQVPTKTLFKFPNCRVPYSISYKFAAIDLA